MNPWDNIKHFACSEFDSSDAPGSGTLMNIEFVAILDKLREKCGFPFIINSGYRTPSHNDTVGGKSESAHTKGVAADIAVSDGIQRMLLVKHALETGINRIGVAKSFIHLDMDYTLPQNVIWTYDKVA